MKRTNKKKSNSGINTPGTARKIVVIAVIALIAVAVIIIVMVHAFSVEENMNANTTGGSGELQEYRDTENSADYMTAEEVTQIEDSQSVIAISWTVPEDYMKTTGAFYVESGGTISIAVNLSPDQSPVYVGIVTPDGSRRYVCSQGLVMHTFEVEESGYYQMYIRNITSEDVLAEGSVAYED